jgi:hypothetical protein
LVELEVGVPMEKQFIRRHFNRCIQTHHHQLNPPQPWTRTHRTERSQTEPLVDSTRSIPSIARLTKHLLVAPQISTIIRTTRPPSRRINTMSSSSEQVQLVSPSSLTVYHRRQRLTNDTPLPIQVSCWRPLWRGSDRTVS